MNKISIVATIIVAGLTGGVIAYAQDTGENLTIPTEFVTEITKDSGKQGTVKEFNRTLTNREKYDTLRLEQEQGNDEPPFLELKRITAVKFILKGIVDDPNSYQVEGETWLSADDLISSQDAYFGAGISSEIGTRTTAQELWIAIRAEHIASWEKLILKGFQNTNVYIIRTTDDCPVPDFLMHGLWEEMSDSFAKHQGRERHRLMWTTVPVK